ncbi:DUF2332 family protein [Novosphingobium sp. ES2-1]|uniref:DUF2332 family protein n=1 Tax=Novosphingobium sp. ES2-1 TaxID=2780074 RepID=UPI0018808A3D|nr:DUF2332 family protein [Novosphingobium sp. ES2-1]QOV93465.1 DUF2332 family protein [Novosphingobium sp. ES2-1]
MPISPPPGRPMLFARGIIPAIAGSLLAIAAPVYAQQESQQNSQQSGQRDDDESETATTSTQFTPLDITQTTRSSSERDVTAEGSSGSGTDKINRATSSNDAKRPEPKLSEFEQFLASMAGRKVSRFGADLLVPSATDYSVPSALVIPPDYPIGVGDVIAINLTGSVVGSAEFSVDANGRIFLPNIGEVSLIGVRYRDLKRHVSQAIGAQYRGYDVSVSIKKLHGIRVFVTGFAQQPGVYTVNSLSTLLGALIAAGGPNAGGSLRSVKLYRNGQEVQDFDLYDILRKGDRSRDPILRNEDVLFVPPVGKQVAVIGSANEEAIYELRGQETLEDLLAYAGGPNQLADPDRVILYRLADRDSIGSRELPRAQLALSPAEGGDVLQILAKGSLARPIEKQSVLVRLEGEVQRPGNYFVAPGTSVGEVVRLAGGFTSRAFVYGTVFKRAHFRRDDREALDPASAVSIAPRWIGPSPKGERIDLASAKGVDLNPLDVRRDADSERLHAYIWPGEQVRSERLRAAIAIARVHPPQVDRGRAGEWLVRELAAQQPQGERRVIFHSMVTQFLPESDRRMIDWAMAEAGRAASPAAPLVRVGLEWNPGRTAVEVTVTQWSGLPESGHPVVFAECHPYAEWFSWIGPEGREVAAQLQNGVAA